MKQILVLNSGSSSIKYELFDMDAGRALESGLVERIGEGESCLKQTLPASTPKSPSQSRSIDVAVPDHRQGMDLIRRALSENASFAGGEHLVGIGHRAVHGGETFSGPTLIDDHVLQAIQALVPLAPLHHPANLIGMEVARSAFPDVPQVAVFDTAYHQTLPPYAYRYAVPQDWYQRYGLRRYGFHGTSHAYVAKQVARHLGRPLTDVNTVVFHLGNGASVTAIRGGISVDTSMGLTPLEGLVMGTRCGDLDPAILIQMGKQSGISLDQMDGVLNKQSGLKGLCGANDMREVLAREAAGDQAAALAVEMFVYRIKKYMGAYHAVLGRLDAVAFTAGIGEHSAEIRARSCSNLGSFGIAIDPALNAAVEPPIGEIQTADSRVKVLVVSTDEEFEIAEQTLACVQPAGR
ncbi:Acetate kinase [Stieleria neptunia]|uniref:Acetate kinase n=1 Tax=Stieleria neptunia TaxID=2527979 RepID=A0A518HTR9_9BACT|nr:acetate kinase [Stieleria neptunia]QDV44242.1 Acetate kinase [Stieleria neptunia]